MSNVTNCAKCVSLSQQHSTTLRAHAEAFSRSAVMYVQTGAQVKVIEKNMIAHARVCNA